MSDVMQNQPQQQNPAGTESLQDPILKQIEQGIEQSVPPEHRQMYLAIVVAGMNIMFSKQTSQLMDQQLSQSGDIVKNVSEGIAKLIVMIFNESKQPVEKFAPAAGLASVTLMAQALEYAEQAKGVQITPDIAAQCTKATMMAVLQKFGISQDQVGQVMAAGQQQGGQEGAQQAQQQPMGA